jgi:hypothetical protein
LNVANIFTLFYTLCTYPSGVKLVEQAGSYPCLQIEG